MCACGGLDEAEAPFEFEQAFIKVLNTSPLQNDIEILFYNFLEVH